MAKMTCYMVMNSFEGTEVFLDEQKAINSFYDQLVAWGARNDSIKKWLDEYDCDKNVLADVSEDMTYFFILEQTVLNY